MSAARWDLSVVDSPDSEPFIVLGDLVLVVRTPRSRDFVTVEAGRALPLTGGLLHSTEDDDLVTSQPLPILTDRWRGEVYAGETVDFRFDGDSYHLTLARLADNPGGSPWVTCDFCLERD